MYSDYPPAFSAIKAAQAASAKGLDHMRVASLTHGNGFLMKEGESFVTSSGLFPSPGGLGQFLPLVVGVTEGGSGRSSSRGGHTIFASNTSGEDDSFQVLRGYKSRVLTPLSVDRLPGTVGERVGPSAFVAGNIMFPDKDEYNNAYPPVRVPAGVQVLRDDRKFAAKKSSIGLLLYGPHQPRTQICGGIIARGIQGQVHDRFCLKTGCTFASHKSKSYLDNLVKGAYYVLENKSYGYSVL